MIHHDLREMPVKEMGSQYGAPSPIKEASAGFDNCTYSIGQSTSPKQPASMDEAGEEPLTPSLGLSTTDWNGLPSPITPTFDQNQCPSKHTEHKGFGTSGDYNRSSFEPDIQTIRSKDQYGERVETPSMSELNNAANTRSTSVILSQMEKSHVFNNSGNYGVEPVGAVFKRRSSVEDQSTSQPQHDENISAHLLDTSIDAAMPLRRSGRIHSLMKQKDADRKELPSTMEPGKKPANTKSLKPIEQPNKTIASCSTDIVPFKGLPNLYSVDWDLQYPPGGSTHPSYPFPNLDPRLVFHESFVPLSNGLPDVNQVPKLLLPLGWKHVSWFGLLPIAFDPYLQGFKLTPVGPLPLTCEELQQNGLHRYVPGGELHPETELLPHMVQFSDGSDGEVYNWEGVNWTLPWTEINNGLDLHYGNLGDIGSSLLRGHQLDSDTTVSQHIEGYACPDGIIDVADGWRWLREQEINPMSIFNPSQEKRRRGAGIQRSNRKVKQPIASLMATAIANSTETPESYLVNQDLREFCPFRSVATPVHTDIRLLRGVEVTLKELLSYFPHHHQWPKCADRLVKAGLNGSDIANTVNMTRCLSGDATKKKPNLATTASLSAHSDSEETTMTLGSGDDMESSEYTTDDWDYDKWETTDYPLLALTHGLISFPDGEDAGPLTKTILWCRAQGRYETLLSEVSDLAKLAGIENTIQRIGSGCPDQNFLLRHTEALKEDRKRVLRVERLKRAAEVAEESKAKRSRKS